jgi:BirA family biotin operon repressor/biotin-[acetyl-CoA-carboxylase] ligase
VESLWAVTFWVALRVADGILEASKLAVSLQWPNDILLDGRKLAGILCVSQIRGKEAFVGCGTGINFHRPRHALALERPAAYLNDYAVTTREQVLACILASFDEAFEALDSPATVARQWEMRARIAGTRYRILIDGEPEPIDATAKRLDEQGGLIVDTGKGERVVRAGDARVLR